MTIRLPTILIAAALLSASCSSPVPAERNPVILPATAVLPLQDNSNLPARLLTAHNLERAAVGVPPLTWDPALAAAAAAYGPVLAASGQLGHAPAEMRAGQGENLWMGTRGAFSLESMIGDWAREKWAFTPGIFPNVSRTGNWGEVGHYTQMIWRDTTRLGCALHQSGRSDYLICRYSPAGNVIGRQVP